MDAFVERLRTIVMHAATEALEAHALLATLGYIASYMAIGWLLGGSARSTRRILATATSMRNVVLCLAIVPVSFPNASVDVPLIAFSALMVPPNLLFLLITRLRDWRARPRPTASN